MHPVGHHREVVTDQVDDRVVFGRLLRVGQDAFAGTGQSGVDSALHRVRRDGAVGIDPHEALGREADEGPRVVHFIEGAGAAIDRVGSEVGADGRADGEVRQEGVAAEQPRTDDVETVCIDRLRLGRPLEGVRHFGAVVRRVADAAQVESHLRLVEGVGDKEGVRQLEVEAEEEGSARRSGPVHVAHYIRCISHGRKSIHPPLPHDIGTLGRA